MFVTPGVVVDGKLVTTDLVDINLHIRILLGQSYYEGWERRDLRQDRSAGQSRSTKAPMESDDDTEAAETRLRQQLFLGDVAALARQEHRRSSCAGHRRRAFARLLSTALAGLVDIGYVKATGTASRSISRRRRSSRSGVRVEGPKVEQRHRRDRARTYFQAYGAAAAFYFWNRPSRNSSGPHKDLDGLRGSGRGDRLWLPRGRARRAVASPCYTGQEDRELPSVSADALERESSRHLWHARAYEVRPKHADFRGKRAGQVQGHRHHARRAQFRSLLPCGVHMYLGNGKTLETTHSPMFGVGKGEHS